MKKIQRIIVAGEEKLQPTVEQAQPRRIRAAAYCRVSTLLEEQDQSYESQVEYYRAFIKSQPEMELVDIYGDHGASGLRTENRPEFERMIQDALDGKIDVIYTKSVFPSNAS